jgi:hypothetical protein
MREQYTCKDCKKLTHGLCPKHETEASLLKAMLALHEEIERYNFELDMRYSSYTHRTAI